MGHDTNTTARRTRRGMMSRRGRREVMRAAEANGASDRDGDHADGVYGMAGADKAPTPQMEHDWDAYTARKHHGSATQVTLSMGRSARTPLNTPYTPQLVKLQLRRHSESEAHERDTQRRPIREVVATLQTSLLRFLSPLGHVRSVVDRLLMHLLPRFIAGSELYVKYHDWILLYWTAVICIPFVLFLSPIVIAGVLFLSPIWMGGIVVLVVRSFMPFGQHVRLANGYDDSPRAMHMMMNSAVNGGKNSECAEPIYRRTILSASDDGSRP